MGPNHPEGAAVVAVVADEHVTDMRPVVATKVVIADADDEPRDAGIGRAVRLAKVSATCALIVEVDPQNLAFDEYDPFAPDDRWSGDLAGVDDESFRLTVGGYELIVVVACDARRILSAERRRRRRASTRAGRPGGRTAVMRTAAATDQLSWSSTRSRLATQSPSCVESASGAGAGAIAGRISIP